MTRTEPPRRSRMGSWNLFEDLGLRPAGEELTRADLLLEIYRELRRRALTQKQAARLLGITQPQVSNLMRGRVEGFSVERLMRLLGRLGTRVSIVLSHGRDSSRHPRIPVVRDRDGSVQRVIRAAARRSPDSPISGQGGVSRGGGAVTHARRKTARK